MIDHQRAVEIARGFLAATYPQANWAITGSVERPFGWGVSYDSREFAESGKLGNVNEGWIGPGALLIRKTDGAVAELYTFQSLGEELRDYAEWHTTGRLPATRGEHLTWRFFSPSPPWSEVE